MIKEKILIVLPAYNESKIILKVIFDIKNEGFDDILVVDDCSEDDTFKQAEKTGVKVLKHSINRGAGAATNTGLVYARNNDYDFVVFMDSDGQHSPKDINKLLSYSKKYDVIIGSRTIDMKNMPVQRKIANFIGSILTWFFFGLFLRDSQSGFKVFNRRAIEKINITLDRYEFCSEIIGEIHKNKLSYNEIPVKVIYTKHSKAKGQNIMNGFRMIIRFILRN